MLHRKSAAGSKHSQENACTRSKSSVRKKSNFKKNKKDSNIPPPSRKSSRKDMLDRKVDQLTSVDINMEDVVDEVIMDSDENEDIIPKSPEE